MLHTVKEIVFKIEAKKQSKDHANTGQLLYMRKKNENLNKA